MTALLRALLPLLLFAGPVRAEISAGSVADGQKVSLAPGKKGTVLLFLSAHCPCSNSHLPLLRSLHDRFPDFQFAAVHSNADESADETRSYFAKAALPFPVLQDDGARLADRFHASKTPHAFVLDAAEKVLYQGGVTSSASAAEGAMPYLADALTQLSKGEEVRTPRGRTLGCAIARP